jgi:hypothetical protein
MRTAKISIILTLLVSIVGISNYSSICAEKSVKKTVTIDHSDKQFLSNNCISCHSETAKEAERLAPPFFAIRKHYLKAHPEKANFTQAILDFLENPSIEKAKMKSAIDKFGLMPRLPFTEKELKSAVEYLYDTEQTHPSYGEKGKQCQGKRNLALEAGKSLAIQTKKILGKNLMKVISKGGSDYAVEFCNSKALTLTDSMGDHLNARIRRLSDKSRNPLNAANSEELVYIDKFKSQLAKGEKSVGAIQKVGNRWRGFYPIITGQMCLQCHGDTKLDIKQSTLEMIASKYPNDLAFDYKVNELRGIWVVDFEVIEKVAR